MTVFRPFVRDGASYHNKVQRFCRRWRYLRSVTMHRNILTSMHTMYKSRMIHFVHCLKKIVRKNIVYSEVFKRHCVNYVQGQSPEPRVREYFYYIDHQGMLLKQNVTLIMAGVQRVKEFKQFHDVFTFCSLQLFLDDARMKNFTSCFKDKKFLAFFFKRLKRNDTGRYTQDFPYVSLCGPERNFVRCDDLPVVFTKVIQKPNTETGKQEDWFGYAHAEELLMVPFKPEKLYMNIESGRVYHPAPDRTGGIGLVRSKIAIEISSLFDFEKGEDHSPTHFTWKNKRYTLDTEWCKDRMLQTVR